MTRWRWVVAVLAVSALTAAGCGGDDGGDADASDAGSEEASGEAEDGQVLLEDDFDDDTNLWDPDDLDFEGQDASIEDGAFTLDWEEDGLADLPEGQSLVPNQVWPSVLDEVGGDIVDTRVEAEVTLEAPGVAGLLCRIADVTPDSEDFRAYFFQVGSTGQVNLAETDEEGTFDALELVPDLDEEERDEIDELPLDDAAFDVEDGGTYELAMTCEDTDDGVALTGSIDGEEVISAVDDEDPIESGVPGILIGQSSLATEVDGFEPFAVSYDSVTVVNLGEEIDEDDLEAAADAAEEADQAEEDPEDAAPPSDDGGSSLGDDLLGVPADPTTIGDYGTDATFDLLATDCFVGQFESCDQLYRDTPVGSLYEAYALHCGGRLETEVRGTCAELAAFASQPVTPPEAVEGFGTDPVFDELTYACAEGDLESCDELYLTTPVGSGYEAYGASCGGRASGAVNGDCIPG